MISSRSGVQRVLELVLAERVDLRAAHDHVARRGRFPTSRAIAFAVSAWSPVMTTILIPASWQRATAVGDVWPGRVLQRGQSQEAQARLCLVARHVPRPARCGARRTRARAVRAGRSPRMRRGSRRGRRRERIRSPLRPRTVVQRSSSSSGAPLAWYQRRPSASSSSVVMRFSRGSKWCTRRRRPSRSAVSSSTSSPELLLRRADSALSVGSPLRLQPPSSRAIVALLQRTAVRRMPENGSRPSTGRGAVEGRALRRRPTADAPTCDLRSACRSCRCRSHRSSPSVSTAVSRLTSARRLAMRRTPTASASVIVGSSPSGTLATSSPIANVDASVSDRPATVAPTARNATPAPTADDRDQLGGVVDLPLQRADLRPHPLGERGDPAELRAHTGGVDERLGLSGGAQRAREHQILRLEQRSGGGRRCARAARRPAATRRSATPCRPRRAPPAIGRRRTAGRPRRPAARRRAPAPPHRPRPPDPPASPVRCGGSIRCSASVARSACSSCTNANAALRMITATIAAASAAIPATSASAAASHNSNASG